MLCYNLKTLALALNLRSNFKIFVCGLVNNDFQRVFRHIFLVNPTVNKENFQIVPVDKREFSQFHCNKLTGEIVPNKKVDISFNFHSPTYGRFKENYLLKIIENGVQKVIHLQGHCREPVVYFDENNIKLKPTVPHAKTSKIVKLINEENFPVNFKFVKKTFFSENQQDKLDIIPITGRLESQSDCDIKYANNIHCLTDF